MKLVSKLITIIISLMIIISTFLVIFTSDEGKNSDDEPPTIDTITGDTKGTIGKITTIYATFSDNVGITEAIIYYKTKSEDSWHFDSIINGTFDIIIPKESEENLQYYIIVNDAAGNGPIGSPSNDGSKYYTIEISPPGEDLIHNVFIEEGTVTWCSDCPAVRDTIHSLFELGKYNFYYVSMVLDENEKAQNRLENDYNILGFPTLYVDGGFSVVTEYKDEESLYAQAIQHAESRDVNKINVTVNAEYLKDSDEIATNIVIENYENETYTGHLRVYLTEINSRWINKYSEMPKPYHYGFIDYIIDKDITVEYYDSIEFETKNKLTDFYFSDLDPENLMVIAAVFSSESIERYSYPPDQNPFDAYFADNAGAAKVVEGGNLPPAVSICSPEVGKLHVFGRPILNTIYRNTIIIGKTTIKTCIDDDTGIEKVEFYIDEKLEFTDDTAPYEWSFRKVGLLRNIIRRHNLMIKVYDENGKTSTDEIDVIALFL